MILVIRDRTLETVPNPLPTDDFQNLGPVSYIEPPAAGALPVARHYVFQCDHANERVRDLMSVATAGGGSVTLIIRHIDTATAALAERLGINILPPCGPTNQITVGTLRRAFARVMRGQRIVAQGFVRNSLARYAAETVRESLLVDALTEASVLANGGTPVLAAVLALQRTGSKFLHDLIGLTVSGRVRLYHEHEIPMRGRIHRRLFNAALAVQRIGPEFLHDLAIGPAASSRVRASHVDASRVERNRGSAALDPQASNRDARSTLELRHAALRRAVLEARRRFIFVSERDPVRRIVSYFSWRHRDSLRSLYDARRRVLRDVPAVQREFDEFLAMQTARQRTFYRRHLFEPFGLDVLRTTYVQGLLVGHHKENTLVVVPIDRLSGFRDDLASIYGADAYPAINDNSLGSRPHAAIDLAFRRQIQVGERAVEALWTIPEVTHVHPRVRA